MEAPLDQQLPDRQTTVCEAAELCVRESEQEHSSTPGNYSVPFPLYHLYIRLQVHHINLSDDMAIIGSVEMGREEEYRGMIDGS